MLFDMLIIFIVVTIICLLLSLFLMEENPMLSIPVIVIGMVFSVICTYGLWDVEFVYIGYNSTIGNTTSYIYSTSDYGNPYGYIFLLIFYIFMLFFLRAGWNLWKEALETKGEMDYRMNRNNRRYRK